MKVTKINIINAVERATGISPELEKIDGVYCWFGKESSVFSECSTNLTTLSHPNSTVSLFVEDFKEKIADAESHYSKPFADVISNIGAI